MRQWLRSSRNEKGFTMKQLADELHISESYYCAIENGYRQMDMDISLAEKLSSILGVSLKYILQSEAEIKSRRQEQHTT